jgi:hypothetical protein
VTADEDPQLSHRLAALPDYEFIMEANFAPAPPDNCD